MKLSDTLTLNNSVSIPRLGFGVFRLTDPQEGEQALESALECGYRLFDTAAVYGNEELVGQVLNRSGIPRKELFVTTKVWIDELGVKETKAACRKSLDRLSMDYIDLYLIHWPLFEGAAGAWEAMEELYAEGLVRAIGVSNFNVDQLDRLAHKATITPAVNQVEFHPHLVQKELQEECHRRGILLEAWSPFIRGKIFSDPVLQKMAREQGTGIGPLVLRWILQKDIIAIPKSATPKRIEENFTALDIALSDAQMAAIDELHRGEHLGPSPENFTEFFKGIGLL
jgi:methylglyoxal/glyoxal reductase